MSIFLIARIVALNFLTMTRLRFGKKLGASLNRQNENAGPIQYQATKTG